MEEEERAAQSAKLQELIRRGGPHDLQEANKLMKVMAGYDTRNKTDWRAKAAEEVASIQQKAKLLEDMLQKHQEGDKIKEGDVFEVSILPSGCILEFPRNVPAYIWWLLEESLEYSVEARAFFWAATQFVELETLAVASTTILILPRNLRMP